MGNNYVDNGYIVCKAIGDVVNNKQNIPIKCKTPDDLDSRIAFLEAHNLITLFDFIVDKKDFEAFLSVDKRTELTDIIKQAVFKQIKYDLMSDSISNVFCASGIRHIVLKGSQLKKYYPANIVRTSNDIDIYVEKSDINIAQRVLQREGFELDGIYQNQEFRYKKEPRYYIELHTNMEGFSKEQKRILKGLADNATKTLGKRYELNDNDCYIYTLFHLYKHFVQSGVGVRMFLDVYLIRKNSELDFDYINPVLKKLCVDGFETVITVMNSCMFEGKEVNDELKDVIEFVFDSGIFGKVSSNLHLRRINDNLKYQNSFERFKVDKGLSFSSMKKRYPVLVRYPFLYPFSFVHRFFYGIIYKRDVLKNSHNSKELISKERVDRYKKIFETAQIQTKIK